MNDRQRILIVDDEPLNIKVLEMALRNTYEIFTSENGYDAIRQVKDTMPDLILLDVMMPDLNGFEVCRIIKSDEMFADISVIFLTALDSQNDQLQGLEIGGIDYLTKPVNLELLKLRVSNHLELKRRNDVIKEQRNLLEAVLARVKLLEGIIPICMFCKKIRDDNQNWQQLEAYISNHSEALFSHGICPHCAEEQKKMLKGGK